MTDTTDDKQVTDQPVADEPKVEETPVVPVQDAPAAPVQDAPAAATDQHGRQLFDVTCSTCGAKTQVPFKPSGDRPVYCRDCYMKQRNG